MLFENESKSYSFKNGFIICSHPMIFGFTKLRIFDSIPANSKKEI